MTTAERESVGATRTALQSAGSLEELRGLLIGREREAIRVLNARVDGEDEAIRGLRQRLVGDGEAIVGLGKRLEGDEKQIAALKKRLDHLENANVDVVASVLPDAIRRRTKVDGKLGVALTPPVEEALQRSVKRNPKPLIDAVSPIIGPAIRRAVSTAIDGMVQRLNGLLENSLSARGFAWRIEAWRTGRPFAEVALLKSLIYRVEQVFLIHKETGLLLQHVVAPAVEARDADMISGMLTAIQDFVHDSFSSDGETGQVLETLRVGELNVWIEQDEYSVLAAVIRGTAPVELRSVLADTLRQIRGDHAEHLEHFEGDAEPFDDTREQLEGCLESYSEQRPARPWRLVILLVLLIAGAIWLWIYLHPPPDPPPPDPNADRAQFAAYLERVADEPGVLVVESGELEDGFWVSGLRDPLARDPAPLEAEAGLGDGRVTTRWEPYFALDPALVLLRARKALQPPPETELTLNNDGVLVATGAAPRPWIHDARRIAPSLPGVLRLDDRALGDATIQAWDRALTRIQETRVSFAADTSELPPASQRKITELADALKTLKEAGKILERGVVIEAIGNTDNTGTATRNARLQRERADHVRKLMGDTGQGNIELRSISAQDRGFPPNERVVWFRVITVRAPPP